MKKNLFTTIAILLMLSGKAQWVSQYAGFTNDTLGFYEMSLPDKNTAWAVCYDGRNGLLSGRPVLDFTRTTNGGTTWIPGKMGNDRTLRFSNISAINGQEAWVAMNKISAIPNNLYLSFAKGGGVFHTTNGGVTWQHTAPGELFNNNSVPRFVHFKDKNHGIAVGDPNDGYFEIYTTNNKGKKWKRVASSKIPAPLAGEIGWISGFAAIGNTVWFGTSAGRMYKSTDFGKTWAVHVVDPEPGTYVNEIAFLDDGKTGVAHLRGRSRTFVFSTTDGGLTWTNYFQPPNWKNSRMTAVPGTKAFVSTAVHPNPQFQGSAVSYDAGQTWTDIENDASKAVCRFYDANTGYAGGFYVTNPFQPGIFKSQIVFETSGCNNIRTAQSSSAGPVVTEDAAFDEPIKAYPNPASDVINISLERSLAGKSSVISIITQAGKVVQTRKYKASNLIQINTQVLPAGLYVLRIETDGQTINKAITIVK